MKYTYADIIIDPQDERLNGAIGKEVYFGKFPPTTLDKANKDEEVGILESINIDSDDVFSFGVYPDKPYSKEDYNTYPCIILKKEPKVKYVPFDLSKKEDRDFLRCKWIKDKKNGAECFIDNFFSDDGVWWFAFGRTGEELLKDFTFLDGTPVGKEVENMNSDKNTRGEESVE